MSKYKIVFFGGQIQPTPLNEKTKDFIETIELILSEKDVMLINTDGRNLSQPINAAVSLYALKNNICESAVQTYYAYLPTQHIQLLTNDTLDFIRSRINLMLTLEKPDLAVCIGGGSIHPYKDIFDACHQRNIPIIGVPHYGGLGLFTYHVNEKNLGKAGYFPVQVQTKKNLFIEAHTRLRTDFKPLADLIKMCIETKG